MWMMTESLVLLRRALRSRLPAVPAPELPPPLRLPLFADEGGEVRDDLLDFAPSFPLDPVGLEELMAFGYRRGTRTVLAGVRCLVPDWQLEMPEVHPVDLCFDERADRLWELLRAAVHRASAASLRPRTTLSGGLDSRAIAAAAASLDSSRFSTGTFGDEDCVDLPVAVELASRLGLRHELSVLPADAALESEERVWRASFGYGGPASAPGAWTDSLWAAQCDVLLSGTSGDVIWGDTSMPGPSPSRRLARLGLSISSREVSLASPPAPSWASKPGALAWDNLWSRQKGATWDGVRSRLSFTPVVPIPWDPPLLSFCLGLGNEDRRGRALLCHMLERHAPVVSAQEVAPVRGPVHDLDRAWRTSSAWAEELDRWIRPDQDSVWRTLGVKRSVAARMVSQVRSGKRNRASFLSRLRAAWHWADRAQGQLV